MKAEVHLPLTVYYDASCSLCASEMRALAVASGEETLRLVDCSHTDFDDTLSSAEGISRSCMMSRLHARDARGRWLVAMDAYEAVYNAAGFTGIARVCGSPQLRPLLDWIYIRVARHRQAISRLGMHRVVRWLLAGSIDREAIRGARRQHYGAHASDHDESPRKKITPRHNASKPTNMKPGA